MALRKMNSFKGALVILVFVVLASVFAKLYLLHITHLGFLMLVRLQAMVYFGTDDKGLFVYSFSYALWWSVFTGH